MKLPEFSTRPGLWTERDGTAIYTRLAFAGVDLAPHWNRLAVRLSDDAQGAGAGMDLSVVAQLCSQKETGLAIQAEALKYQTLFRSPCASARPSLRVLALAAEMDIGGNTPLEFLLEGSDVELITLYVKPDAPLPAALPAHDVAIVIAPDDAATRETLARIGEMITHWPVPVLNGPERIGMLDRNRLCRLLAGIEGLEIPLTERVDRDQLAALGSGEIALQTLLADGAFPIIARPVGSHAGFGLAKLDSAGAVAAYLEARPEGRFFISRFVDYASPDGQFRKFRLVIVDGRAYACHMAVADEWKVWYLNGDMILNAGNRREEEVFMSRFDEGFGRRHGRALDEMIARIDLSYFQVDCAETRDGKLLVFEADNAAIVHDMDPVSLFPYKAPQMRKVFAAFVAMLKRAAHSGARQAA